MPVANSVVVMVCRSPYDGFHRLKIPSMFLSKLPVSSFLLAATFSFDEIYQVISFLFLFFTFKCLCVFHPVKEKLEACMTCLKCVAEGVAGCAKTSVCKQIVARRTRFQRACRTSAAFYRSADFHLSLCLSSLNDKRDDGANNPNKLKSTRELVPRVSHLPAHKTAATASTRTPLNCALGPALHGIR